MLAGGWRLSYRHDVHSLPWRAPYQLATSAHLLLGLSLIYFNFMIYFGDGRSQPCDWNYFLFQEE